MKRAHHNLEAWLPSKMLVRIQLSVNIDGNILLSLCKQCAARSITHG